MNFLLISFLAGTLTVLSPCVIPLLPIIVGGSLKEDSKRKAYLITLSLAISVVLFTLLLKATTLLINVSPQFWQIFSGGLIIALGVITIYPNIWENLQFKLGLSGKSDELLLKSSQKRGDLGSILTGMALGPVFSSCSPTYALILATVLPQSFAQGVVNLIIYALGLSMALLALALGGQKVAAKLKWAVNPQGTFKKVLGGIFIVVGLTIATGLDKDIQTALVNNEIFDVTKIEERIIENTLNKEIEKGAVQKIQPYVQFNISDPVEAPELQGIVHWINSNPLTMQELRGKVVLIDFWTYSCINCIRTIPYINAWYEKYKDMGLIIIGVHAPEFAFEQVKSNVGAAVDEYEIQYPVAMDNNFTTWRAYNNRYWPAKYFIDKDGNIRHYHFGEGDYSESEKVIQALIAEDTSTAVDKLTVDSTGDNPPIKSGQTPETYLGYERTENFFNQNALVREQTVTYIPAQNLTKNQWTIGGDWEIREQELVSKKDGNILKLNFSAKNVYLVVGSNVSTTVKATLISPTQNKVETIEINEPRLYQVIGLPEFVEDSILELEVPEGVILNAFTFGS